MATLDLTRPAAYDPEAVAAWEDSHRYTPAPRHRRRLLLKIMDRLEFSDVLDAGCAQPFLLGEIVRRYPVQGLGCDLAGCVIESNRIALPGCEFRTLDLTCETWPEGRKFDLVVCSEVLEHLAAWPDALANLVKMTRKHLLITVPGGPVRAMDRMVGHVGHFQGPELTLALEALGCRIERVERWGWPLHTAYKAAISRVAPQQLYSSFSGGGRFGPGKKWLSECLYRLFFVNDLFGQGHQLIVHARPGDES